MHILEGDVPEVQPGRILGHEAVGTVTRLRHGGRWHTGHIRRGGQTGQPPADTSPMITRRFTLNEFEAACDVFSRPGEMGALKVLLSSSKGITYRHLVLVEITKSGFYREPVARIHRRACAAAIAVA